MSGDLGVGFACETNTGIEKLLLELGEVLNDSVMNQGKLAGWASQVRVGILIGWSTVGCPAGVSDTNVRVLDGMSFDVGNQVIELAGFFASGQCSITYY